MANTKNEFQAACINALQPLKLSSLAERVASYMTAVACLESANFTSNVFIKNNNAIGMKMPHTRKSKYINGTGSDAPVSEGLGSYASYASVSDCAFDFVEWLKYNNADFSSFLTLQSFIDFMGKKGFYGISPADYYSRVNKFIGDRPYSSGSVASATKFSLITVLAVCVGGYFLFK